MRSRSDNLRFETAVLPYLDSGFNLAYWLISDRADAEDAIQNASIKAYKALGQFRGTDSKAWFLAIVRNECLSCLHKRNRARYQALSLVEDQDSLTNTSPSPADVVELSDRRLKITEAIDSLTPELREVLLLRELEDMSYQQIATTIGMPIGTVMSRLSRARSALMKMIGSDEETV